MESTRNFRQIPIAVLCDFPETNSKITKKFCILNKGPIPVYASSKDENSTLGFIQDNLKGVKYYADCLSWNRNGSVGYVFVRNHKFATNEDHRALIIKDQYKCNVDAFYLKFALERELFLTGFSYLDKCGVNKIKKVNVLIPVKNDGSFDLVQQRNIAAKYAKVKELRTDLDKFFKMIMDLKVDMGIAIRRSPFSITKLFNVKKGNAKYTKRYIHDHKGPYPVYSSQTLDDGEIGRIDTYDYDEECFTWTTDGIKAGTVFYRNCKFSITTHCGILQLKKEFRGRVDYNYLHYVLNKTLPKYTLGEWGNKRLGTKRMGEISIDMPINKKGELDLKRQREIAARHNTMEEIMKYLAHGYEEIMNAKVTIS